MAYTFSFCKHRAYRLPEHARLASYRLFLHLSVLRLKTREQIKGAKNKTGVNVFSYTGTLDRSSWCANSLDRVTWRHNYPGNDAHLAYVVPTHGRRIERWLTGSGASLPLHARRLACT